MFRRYEKNLNFPYNSESVTHYVNKPVIKEVKDIYKHENFSKPSKIYYFFLFLGASAFIVGLIVLIYSTNSISTIQNASPVNSEIVLESKTITELNKHYMCVNNVTLNLPTASNLTRGKFVSIAALQDTETSVRPSVTVYNPDSGLSQTITETSVYMVSLELLTFKWKRVN